MTSKPDRATSADDPIDPERHEDLDPGAFVGQRPERQAETIPGGVSDADERIAAHSTQSSPLAGEDRPDGHREGPPASDGAIREAGQSR